jgi:hypothetical protein
LALAVGLRGGTSGGEPEPGWLVPKGERPGANLEAACPNRAPGECRRGDRLVFSADGVKKDGLFAAYAECGSRERIWYFPTADGTLPTLRATAGHTVVDQAARIGDEHGVGPCKLHLFLLEQREDRATLLSGGAHGTGSAVIPLTILP